MQVAVQLGKGVVGGVVEDLGAGGVVGVQGGGGQLGHITGIQYLGIVAFHCKAQRSAFRQAGIFYKNIICRIRVCRIRVCRIRVALCCGVYDRDRAVGIGQLAPDGLGESIGQVLGAGQLLHLDVGFGAGLDQRDRRRAKQCQQHQADHQLHEGGTFFVVQRGGHGVVSSFVSSLSSSTFL